MKSGSAQTDNVSGEAKLSCTRSTVRSVGRRSRCGGFGEMPRRQHAGTVEHPVAVDEFGPRRLDALQRLVGGIETKHADLVRAERVALRVHGAGMEDRHTLRIEAAVGLPQPQLAAVQRQRAAAALEIIRSPAPRRARA